MSLDPDAIRDGLAEHGIEKIGCRIVALEETESTNDHARKLAQAWDDPAPHGTVVFAESQTAGRGRRGRRWVSPPRANLLLSILLRPDLPIERWSRFTHIAGLAVALGLEELAFTPKLKWPNDVYLDDRKLAGILVESDATAGFVIVEIGLNVNGRREEWPDELRDELTSLREVSGGETSRESVAICVLAQLEHTLNRSFAEVHSGIEERDYLNGKRLVVAQAKDDPVIGIGSGFGPEGELLLREESGGSVITVTAAEHVRLVARHSDLE